jgi:hypothetical protein
LCLVFDTKSVIWVVSVVTIRRACRVGRFQQKYEGKDYRIVKILLHNIAQMFYKIKELSELLGIVKNETKRTQKKSFLY